MHSSSSTTAGSGLGLVDAATTSADDGNHTRNSSATSQNSAGYASSSGPASVNQISGVAAPTIGGPSAHSRQSSSGDSSHGR